jgi:hypothetical protein
MSTLTIATSFVRETLSLRDQIEGAFIDLAARLARIRSEELWREVGYSSYEEFLAEMRLSPATASKLVSIHERFVVDLKLDRDKLAPVGWSSLYQLLKVVKTKSDAKEWLGKANLLKRDDLEREVKEAAGKMPEECQKGDHDYYELKICRRCGERVRVYE